MSACIPDHYGSLVFLLAHCHVMSSRSIEAITDNELVAGLIRPDAYPHRPDGPIELHETHLSRVFLAGDFAYKIKKAIKNDFLDYSTLAQRKHYCDEEFRLDRRFAGDLYIGVVPICRIDGELTLESTGHPVEFAVKMLRFPKGALLSERIDAGILSTGEVVQLAHTVARFHQDAAQCEQGFANTWPIFLRENSRQIIQQLQKTTTGETATTLNVLRAWSDEFLQENHSALADRVDAGLIRECHGDLHLQNVVHWGERLMPFDGIEFNDRLRWIDVLSDAAFLAMDLAARGHLDLSRTFMNAYLESAGDYRSLSTLRWYLFYRSLVRALDHALRTTQSDLPDDRRLAAQKDIADHVGLAYRFTLRETPSLWITHGLSGSGKTTFSEAVVQRHDAIRLRSDLLRKRNFGLSPTERPSLQQQQRMYSRESNDAVYAELRQHASDILRSGYSVVVDAAFLTLCERNHFRQLAAQEGVSFAILDCQTDEQTLRQRIADRIAGNSDASDADVNVLDHQLATHEPLTESETRFVVDIPDIMQTATQL